MYGAKVIKMKKEKFTAEEYEGIGAALLVIRSFLMNLDVQAFNRYTKQNKPALKIRTAIKSIDQARSLFEDQMFIDYPNMEGNESLKVFYGYSEIDVKGPEGLKSIDMNYKGMNLKKIKT